MQNSSKEQTFLCEVVDQHNRPLAHFSYATIAKQELLHRLALGVLQTKDGRYVLYRRSCQVLPQQGKWDILALPVPVGNAAEETILELLVQKGMEEPPKISSATGYRYDAALCAMVNLLVLQVSAVLHPSCFENNPQILFVDEDELKGLRGASPDLFTRELLWYVDQSDSFFK